MGTAGQNLFQIASSAFWDMLNRLRSDAAVALAALGPEPGFGGPPLNGRLLTAITPNTITSADPAVSVFINALQSVLPDINTPGVAVTLHGFDPGGGQLRSLAVVASIPAPAVTIVAALTAAGAQGIAFEIDAVGAGEFGPLNLDLIDNWTLTISGDVGGGARLQLPRGGLAQVLDPGGAVQVMWTVQRSGTTTTFGPDSGPNLTMSTLQVSAKTALDSGGAPTINYSFSLPDANLSISPSFLSALVGNSLTLPVNLDLDANPATGLKFRSGGVKSTLPVTLDLPGIKIDGVEITAEAQGSGLDFGFGVNFTGGLDGLPISFSVEGLGVKFPVAVGSGALGIDPGAVQPLMPTGLGIDLTLPVLSGGGFLEVTGPGGYGGVLQLDLIELSIQAFGLLQLPVNGQPLSFVAIISVNFPFPGIQLGFGFSLNAVGGIVAINRRVDSPSLESSVVDGSVNQLLFPADPASHGPAIVATLGKVFPAAEGHLVIGPMLQIAWGGRILSLSVAVIIDMPSPFQLIIIGRVELALPDPDAPLVLLEATVVGAFQFSPSFSVVVVASLEGSYIVGIALHGDLLFLLRTGDDAAFILSVGGFHPRYVPPPGVPRLHRIQLDILPPGFPGLRSETYFAVTSNTVQFGAHLQLCDEIAGCGVDGWFDFDALFQWDPVFCFSVHCSAGVAVQVLGETLMGISFDLVVEGPAPWHIHGSGSIDLFLFSASLDFDVKWGPGPPTLPPPPDLSVILAAALADPSAWVGTQPRGDDSMVTLSRSASDAIEGQQAVHPLGGVVVRQRALPLGIEIARYQNQPIAPQTWSIAAVQLTPIQPGTLDNPTLDEFPAGSFLNLSEDEKLHRPAFEQFTSGTDLTQQGVTSDPLRAVDTSYEVALIPDIYLGNTINLNINLAYVLYSAEAFLAIDDVHAVPTLWEAVNPQAVTVMSFQPVGVASTATMQSQPVATTTGGFTATLQAAASQYGAVGPAAAVQVVERWEVSA
jgi:hypothetical protein